MTPRTPAPEVVPAESTDPFQDFSTLIAKAAARHPEKSALVFEGRRHTWGDFDRNVNRVANALRELGVGSYDKVAILAHNCPEVVEAFTGAIRAGACAVPLATMATPDSLARMLADCGAKVVLASAQGRETLESQPATLENIPAGNRIALDFHAPGWQPYKDWLVGAPDAPPSVTIRPDHHFNIIYSSGTTGVPKGILHDHRMRSRQLIRMAQYGLSEDAITLVTTPWYSNTTLVAALPTLAGGGTLVLMRKFDVEGFLELAQAEHVSHAMLVPVQYQRILAYPGFERYDLSSFRVKLSTSAPLSADTIRDALSRWPGKLFEIYGLTEGGVTTVLDAAAFPDKLHSAGRPAPGVELRIVDDSGRACEQGEVGEIVGRAATMMVGYYNRPELTTDMIWTSPEGETFFRTGDIGRVDEDGFVYILDRKKDVILSGGFNIFASDLEAVLLEHEAVADATVLGIPSERWGETPLGLVVLTAGGDTSAEAILTWANERLGRNQRLAAVEVRDHLPRSAIGKVLKRELRQPYWDAATSGGSTG